MNTLPAEGRIRIMRRVTRGVEKYLELGISAPRQIKWTGTAAYAFARSGSFSLLTKMSCKSTSRKAISSGRQDFFFGTRREAITLQDAKKPHGEKRKGALSEYEFVETQASYLDNCQAPFVRDDIALNVTVGWTKNRGGL